MAQTLTDRIIPPDFENLPQLLKEVRSCRACAELWEHEPRPVLRASNTAKVLIVGQAPGRRVHETGIPWNDPSGDELRRWMGVERELFYNESIFSIIPSGLCYPGKGKSGDNPPSPRCAPLWKDRLLEAIPQTTVILAVGSYAIGLYLQHKKKKTLTETVRSFSEYLPEVFPLVHPSPRNRHWHKKNPWFETDVIPELRRLVQSYL